MPRERFEPECPGPDCPMCSGAACDLCGAGCWNNSAPFCEHATDERHVYGGDVRQRSDRKAKP